MGKKLIEEFKTGNVKEAILLVNASTSESWFQPLFSFPICFTNHRIRYVSSAGEKNSPTKSNAFIYLGDREFLFADKFNKVGEVVKKLNFKEET